MVPFPPETYTVHGALVGGFSLLINEHVDLFTFIRPGLGDQLITHSAVEGGGRGGKNLFHQGTRSCGAPGLLFGALLHLDLITNRPGAGR